MKLKCATAYPCANVYHSVKATAKSHAVFVFKEEEKEPLAQGFGHQVMRFLLHDLGILHKTPATRSFEHSVVLFP